MCTDNRQREFSLATKCRATCSKVHGARLVRDSEGSKCSGNCDPCFAACVHPPSTCGEWREVAYTEGGCAVACTPKAKLQYRPFLSCTRGVSVGSRVFVLQSNSEACVTLVLEQFAMVQLDDGERRKVHVDTLISMKSRSSKCTIATGLRPPPTNALLAIITGPTQVSAQTCNVTLDAYQSTSPVPSQLQYQWIVPADLDHLVTSELSSSQLTFSYLPSGNHTIGLEIVDGAGGAARAPEFKLFVRSGPTQVVSLTCPPGVCSRVEPGTYELQVPLSEQTTLALDVELASECGSNTDVSLRPIEWQQRTSSGPTAVWERLQVRLRDISHFRITLVSLFRTDPARRVSYCVTSPCHHILRLAS